ncbi:MAG: AAA family ATPase, partial [Victivallales bacterium]|nr:AAA family ATPase [Victivallales bacterium]
MSTPVQIQTSSSDFPRFIQEGSYYVDKTMLVQEIGEQNREVALYTRPRRFGKSLNQNMLQAFFNIQTAMQYEHLFDGLAISRNRELCEKHQGKYPVIKISFARACTNTFDKNHQGIAKSIQDAIYDYKDIILNTDATVNPRINTLREYMCARIPVLDDPDILLIFTEFLHQHYKQKCVVLLDEYDVPLQHAFLYGHFDEMINLIRPIMTSTFKDNPHLKWGVITGCLKIAKESFFTGLNNLYVNTILSRRQSEEHFGFTQAEVDKLLRAAELSDCHDLVKQWYDGYLFGNKEVYNPFSVVNFVAATLDAGEPQPLCFWANTSGNDIIRKMLMLNLAEGARDALQPLIDGQSIPLPIVENTVFRDMDNDPATLWSTMLFTGYLKP